MDEDATGERVFVVTYSPLVITRYGRDAAERHGLPPFIDGSIRREPDLQHDYPSISCLCRAGKFAPRLRVGDHVLYLAGKRRYGGLPAHWRMTAVLRVIRTFEKHAAAAKWYRAKSLPVPANCMVRGNAPAPLEQSHRFAPYRGCVPDGPLRRRWDAAYRRRADMWGAFVVCKPLFRDLSWDAPVVHNADLKKVFGRVPGTQNPATVSVAGLRRLMRRLHIDARLSSP